MYVRNLFEDPGGARPSSVYRSAGNRFKQRAFFRLEKGPHPSQRIDDYLQVPVSYLITGEMPDVPTSDRPILRAVLEACAGLSDQDLSVVYTVASALRGRSDVD